MALPDNQKLPIDGAGKVLKDGIWPPYRCDKLITFIGGTSNAWGDKDGTLAAGAVFLVNGSVRVRIVAACTVSLVGAGKLEMGVTGETASIIAQIADAEGIDAGEMWASADAPTKVTAVTGSTEKIVTGGSDIILTQSVADITAGAIKFTAIWFPISEDGKVLPSNN
ncbi:MAG: hypothetical protein ABIJ43_03490 [Candidatus Beckwithbacteria bacterium]